MTIDEAIKRCEEKVDCSDYQQFKEWLEELKYYRKKNKVFNGDLKGSLDKQMEQPVTEDENGKTIVYCPRCKESINYMLAADSYHYHYCVHCGQKVKL